MKESDDPIVRKDEEPDFSDDPVLASLNKELESVLRFTDNRLIIILGILVAVTYLLDHLQAPPAVLFLGAVFCVGGGIGYTIFSVTKGKQRLAARYGLVCRTCGHRPKTSQIMLVAQVRRCAICGNKLIPHMPSARI